MRRRQQVARAPGSRRAPWPEPQTAGLRVADTRPTMALEDARRVVRFRAVLERRRDGRYVFMLPATSADKFGTHAQIMVRATIADRSWDTLALPNAHGGHFVFVRDRLRAQLRLSLGKTTTIALRRRARKAHVAVPSELLHVLRAREETRTWWSALTPFERRTASIWIGQARREPTRARRVDDVLRRARRAYGREGPFFPPPTPGVRPPSRAGRRLS